MALKELEAKLRQFKHTLQLIDQNDQSSIPTGSFFTLPVPIGELHAIPWQTHPATLHLNCPAEQNEIIYEQVVSILKDNQEPFLLSTQSGLQTEANAILVHGIALSAEGLNLLVSVQPDVLPEGPIQIYPLTTHFL